MNAGGSKHLPVVAFGPRMPTWGSWEWVGADLQRELATHFQTLPFDGPVLPACDAVVVVKQAPALEFAGRGAARPALVYAPVDFYGSAGEIDADGSLLRRCARIVVHTERLRRYFEPYAPVEFMDHHVKFAAPLREAYRPEGFFLWVGVRTNLPPLVEWVNAHPLPGELRIVTNLEDPQAVPAPGDLGFRRGGDIRVYDWSPELQREFTAHARAALDIKGADFRSRHKPPAKAMDFIASGVPLAMNPDSSPVEHLARMGFEVASPLDTEWWLSRSYWEETQRFGRALRELLSLERIGRRYKRILDEVVGR
jgi:hypothetical protein